MSVPRFIPCAVALALSSLAGSALAVAFSSADQQLDVRVAGRFEARDRFFVVLESAEFDRSASTIDSFGSRVLALDDSVASTLSPSGLPAAEARAELRTTVLPDRISMLSTMSTGAGVRSPEDFSEALAQTEFAVDFTVADDSRPFQLKLDSTFDSFPFALELRLQRSDGTVLWDVRSDEDIVQRFELETGAYAILARASAFSDSEFGSGQVLHDLSLAPIPESSTWVSMLLGTLLLASSMRRKTGAGRCVSTPTLPPPAAS